METLTIATPVLPPRRRTRPRTAWWVLAVLACGPLGLRPAAATPQDCHAVSRETCEVAHALGRGINLGNMLEAPREGDWGVRVEPRFIALATRHFQTVRLPVRWSNHAAPDADARIDEAFARRVDGVVDALLARGVRVILNVHHYTQLTGGTLHPKEFAVDPEVLEERLVNLWRQIAWRYRERPPRLLFELLNEPHGALEGERWNRLAARALAAVRPSNPTRLVLIGPGDWNHPRALQALRLPPDPFLIVSIHTYDPFEFTHQGVTWRPDPLPTGTLCCDEAQRAKITQALDQAMRWNREHGVPLHLGEFGAYSAGDLASRAAYARFVRDEAERRGIGWAWWEWGSDFSRVYDPARRAWVEPLRRALLD